MNQNNPERENLILRAIVIVTMMAVAAALRVVPHPWNLTPVGAIALFSGATVRDRRLAFAAPLLILFVSDCFIGFHRLMPVVYGSFLISVAIGHYVAKYRSAPRIALATVLGAGQFFVITNFAIWNVPGTYPHTGAGLVACYVAAIPFFWNTLAGDAFYATLLFGGLALAERLVPAIRQQQYPQTS